MSKKDSNVILKSGFKNQKEISEIYVNFKKKFTKINKHPIVVAISGGPDSLALAALTKAFSYENKLKFYYVLIDHQIRKKSTEEACKVKILLKKYNISLIILTNSSNIKKNIQSEARKIRYQLLLSFCNKKKAKTILTAHNLEDQVETFFIRLSRGSGLTGLSSMKTISKLDKNIRLFRPLLDIKKNNLVKISKKVFGKYFKDSSNNNKKYLRTKIRNLKKPLNQSGIHYDQIIKSINNLASSSATLDEYYKKTFEEIVKKSKSKIELNFEKFMTLNNEIKLRLINDSIKILKNNYYALRSKKVDNLIKSIKTKTFKKHTLGGCIFYVKKDKICLIVEKR